jgi:hypothetical protein
MLAELAARLRSELVGLRAQRAEIAKRFPDPDGGDLWCWAQRQVLEPHAAPAGVLPVADAGGRRRSGFRRWRCVRRSVRALYRAILAAVAECGLDARLRNVLLLGCGSGGLLRYLMRHAGALRIEAADRRERGLAWAS